MPLIVIETHFMGILAVSPAVAATRAGDFHRHGGGFEPGLRFAAGLAVFLERGHHEPGALRGRDAEPTGCKHLR